MLVAVVVYFALIVPMNQLKKVRLGRKDDEKEAPAAPTELELLAEIRDLLARPATANAKHADPTDGQPG